MSLNYLTQLAGMAKYEFKMHWRRRALWVITLTMLVITGFAAMLGGTEIGGLVDKLAEAGGLTDTAQVRLFMVLFATWVSVAVLLSFIFPIAVADTIPLDRQLQIRELLDSLPLHSSIYLLGKLLGIWLAAFAGVILSLPITAAIWWITAGSYDVGKYAQMWLIGGAALIVLNGGLIVLAAAGQPTRRRAFAAAVVVYILPFLFVGRSLRIGITFDPVAYIDPLRAPIITRYTNLSAGDQFAFVSPEVSLTILVGLVELVIVGVLVWGWMRWREQHI
jgi:hypothetical protein